MYAIMKICICICSMSIVFVFVFVFVFVYVFVFVFVLVYINGQSLAGEGGLLLYNYVLIFCKFV